MSVAAASSTATFTADEIIVETALGGLTYRLPSFSKTINLATTGAGGMDTGTAPANGYVALYAIYNPTTGASALLARNATSSAQPEVYGGANMPAGYTASALVSVWPTNASGQFGVGVQQGRRISISSVMVLSQTTSTTSTIAVELSIASAVPPNATGVGGTLYCHFNTSTGSAPTLTVSPASPFVGANQLFCSGDTTTPDFGCPFEISGISSQRLYYSIINSVSASVTYTLIVTKYEF
ncbi:phage tail protein [Burkholderia multivorans]|nr:phage tail protein [Burkholderia multivorans]